MSRYLLLFILNLPLVLLALLGAIVDYKLKKIPLSKLLFRLSFWLLVLAGLALAYPIYQYLFDKQLTASEPLSLFDVAQITFIIFLLYRTSRFQARLESNERRLRDIHQEISIKLSE